MIKIVIISLFVFRIFCLNGQELRLMYPIQSNYDVSHCQFSDDEKYFATIDKMGLTRIYDTRSLKLVTYSYFNFSSPNNTRTYMSPFIIFSPDSKFFFRGDPDGFELFEICDLNGNLIVSNENCDSSSLIIDFEGRLQKLSPENLNKIGNSNFNINFTFFFKDSTKKINWNFKQANSTLKTEFKIQKAIKNNKLNDYDNRLFSNKTMQLSAFHHVNENNIDIDFFELFHLNANQEYKKTGIINNTFYSELRSIHGSAKTLELDCIGKSSNFEIPITDNYSFLKFQDKVNEIDNYLKYQFRWDEDTISRILFDSVIFNKFNEGRELSICNLRNNKHIKNLDFDQVTFLLNRGILLISYPTLKDSLNTYLLDLKNFSLIDSLITSGYLKDICDIDTVNKYFCSVNDVQYGAKISFKHDYIHGYHNMLEKNTNLHKGIPFPVFSDDFKYVVTTSVDGKTKVWDNKTDSLIFDLDDSLKGSSFTSLGYYDQYNNLVYDVKDKVLRCWNPKNSNIIFSLALFNNGDYLIKVNNSPYYMCSKDASKMLHYVTPSLKVIGFEQLDPVYNRPDIVLDSIGKYFGNEDSGMIDEYRKSWEKRIDCLGLDKEKLGKGEIAVPNAEIIGADVIAYENKEGKLNIKVSANDPKYPLRRFNVFVNEVPLYGSAGISIAHLKKQVWDTTVSVPLSVGENKIQVSVMNELGLENFKYPTYVNYTPIEEIIAKTHYIGIGVNEFKDSSHNLNYCVKDVRDLAKAFSSENKNIDTLIFTDKQVTKENILALKDYLKKTSVNDKVIISCSSHGLLDDSLNFYLATHDVNFDNPKARGLKYEELEGLMDGIPARQKLLLLDACNSGENDKTEVLKKELQQKEKNMDSSQVLAARGVIIKLEEENKSNFKKMNELFVNVRNNTGSVIISAAGGQESALEAIIVDGKTIENGAFTYSILECIKQNEGKELKVNTLKKYAEKRVEEITNGKQKPTSRQETMEVDWGVR